MLRSRQTTPAPLTNVVSAPLARIGRMKRAIIMVVAAGISAAWLSPAAAGEIFTDIYTLKTANQSMLGQGFSASTGFQGAKWGSYAGSAPLSGGISLIAGSERTWVSPFGCGDRGASSCYEDTRVGAAVSLASSGRIGVEVHASAAGGTISAVVPITTSLAVGDKADGVVKYGSINPFFLLPGYTPTPSAPTNGVFRVSGSNVIQSGASIAAVAPSFKAGIDAFVNLDNAILASGCFFGCSDTAFSASANPGKFNLVDIDSTAQEPVSMLGGAYSPVTFGKGYIYRAGEAPCLQDTECAVKVAAPALAVVKAEGLQNASGGNVNGNQLSLATSSPVLQLTADLTGITQSLLGARVDILNPQIDLEVGTLKGSLFDLQAGVQLSMDANFSLNPAIMTALTFDKPVSQWLTEATIFKDGELFATLSGDRYTQLTVYREGQAWKTVGQRADDNYNSVQRECYVFNDCTYKDTSRWASIGTTAIVDLAMGADLLFDGGADGHLLSRTYFIDDTVLNFSSHFTVNIEGILPIQAACFDIELSGLGGTGLNCAYRDTFNLGSLADIALQNGVYALGGFDARTFTNDAVTTNVPEPGTAWLILVALSAVVCMRGRRSRRSAGSIDRAGFAVATIAPR